MANNFFDSGFDDFFGELANLAIPPTFTLPPLSSPAAGNSQNTDQSALGRSPFGFTRLPAFGTMCPLSPPSPSGFIPYPGASPWSSTPCQGPRQAAQAGAGSGTAASFIAGPTLSHGAPHPPTPMPSTAPASRPEPLFQQSTTIGQFLPAPANLPQPQLPQLTVNNLSHLLSSSPPPDSLCNIATRAFIPPTQQQQREPNSDHYYLDQFTRDFSSHSIPSASGTPQRSATVDNNSNTNNPLSRTHFPRIYPLPLSSASRVAPPVRLRVPPPPSTSNTNAEDSDSDSANNMPCSSRPTRTPRGASSSARQQLPLFQAPRVSGAASSSSAATASAQQAAKYQSNQVQTASQATSRRASNVSASAAGSATKRKHDEFELDNFDDDDLFGDNDLEVIDLVDKDVPDMTAEKEEREEDKKKNWVKLSQFQCVICMDDVTDLTVTYCGHLFCSECLHSALQITPHKRICPICRQKIENKNASGKFGPKAKGYYPLEIKMMTKKSLEKKAAAIASRNNLGEH